MAVTGVNCQPASGPLTFSGRSFSYDGTRDVLWLLDSSGGAAAEGSRSFSTSPPYAELSTTVYDTLTSVDGTVGQYTGFEYYCQGTTDDWYQRNPTTGVNTAGPVNASIDAFVTGGEALDSEGNSYMIATGLLEGFSVVNTTDGGMTLVGTLDAAFSNENSAVRCAAATPDPSTGNARWVAVKEPCRIYVMQANPAELTGELFLVIDSGNEDDYYTDPAAISEQNWAIIDHARNQIILVAETTTGVQAVAIDLDDSTVVNWRSPVIENDTLLGSSYHVVAGQGQYSKYYPVVTYTGSSQILRATLLDLTTGEVYDQGTYDVGGSATTVGCGHYWDEFQNRLFVSTGSVASPVVVLSFTEPLYPSEPTEEEAFDPFIADQAPVLKGGPVIRTMNDNALRVQAALSKLADIANPDGDVVQWTLDLNGYSLLNILDDGSPQAVLLKT